MPPRRKAAKKSADSKTRAGATTAMAEEQTDPAQLTVPKLKQALQERSLETTGRKAELVERLKEALEEEQGDIPAPKVKKAKKEPEQTEFQKAKEILQEQDATKKNKSVSNRKVDRKVPFPDSYTVVEDWDCMLNQTNVGHNNNKYYVIQVLHSGVNYYVWNRWGRVGEDGQNIMKGPFHKQDAAEKEFSKKFKDKTQNHWDNRDNFTAVSGKYTLLDMADSDEEEEIIAPVDTQSDVKPKKVKSCSLEKTTQELVKLIFDNDMFNNALKSFDIDVKKMPLGKLSKGQIAKGFDILENIEAELTAKKTGKLTELSSNFFTIIPHDFGRQRPPTINNPEALQQKKDMLMVLGDIELALSMQKDKDKGHENLEEVPHPFDVNYGLLKTDLSLLESSSDLYKTLETYTNNTKSAGGIFGRSAPVIQHIWEVNRHSAFDRYKQHDKLENRKLLWHGTNVAVVAAILKDGLRIMPHSGGRVGKGIYFASEQMKSAGYVRPSSKNIGIMFLNEVALGKENAIVRDDSGLKKAPAGYDSVVARGRTEPDSKLDTKIQIDGRDVIVPQGKAINQSNYSNSNFYQSEYLVYKESQNRIRYLLTFKF